MGHEHARTGGNTLACKALLHSRRQQCIAWSVFCLSIKYPKRVVRSRTTGGQNVCTAVEGFFSKFPTPTHVICTSTDELVNACSVVGLQVESRLYPAATMHVQQLGSCAILLQHPVDSDAMYIYAGFSSSSIAQHELHVLEIGATLLLTLCRCGTAFPVVLYACAGQEFCKF